MRAAVFTLHGENEDDHWWFVGRRKILLAVIDAIMIGQKDDLIIDVGCGTGGTVSSLDQKYRCIGVDESLQAVEIARQKYPNCRFIQGKVPDDVRDFGQDTALFTIMDVLEHVADDRKFLSDVVSMARPGAHILVTVPAGHQLWSEHDVAAGHVRRYDEAQFNALWQDLPVMPCMVSFFNARLFPLIWLIRQAERLLPILAKRGSDLNLPHPFINGVLRVIFAGEKTRICRLLIDGNGSPYRRGVSLLALLQRK